MKCRRTHGGYLETRSGKTHGAYCPAFKHQPRLRHEILLCIFSTHQLSLRTISILPAQILRHVLYSGGCCTKKLPQKCRSRYKQLVVIYFFPLMTSAIFLPISAGLCTTWIPHSVMIFILAAAVSSAPPMMAPAWPILLPGGAV